MTGFSKSPDARARRVRWLIDDDIVVRQDGPLVPTSVTMQSLRLGIAHLILCSGQGSAELYLLLATVSSDAFVAHAIQSATGREPAASWNGPHFDSYRSSYPG